MKISGGSDVDVFQLFVHEGYDFGPFAPESVAAGLNAVLDREIEDATARVIPPSESGLDRLTLSWEPYGGDPEGYNSRYYTVSDVKMSLPQPVVAVLEKLNSRNLELR